ncbi:bifunctional methylenetetrahydrofolate dehydrogenase/methenyltetrahydrofolate cyclohydrolase FolD [Hippea maritima]|uniref:Bifunctional protein FolD n=1 Tax=Hippea maritima (strain ATCC 700847 / DSM 10411 / MH2) TaxID=760142 RepID=F2LVA1_HIPMA|nr:bifunctional methylenetetrahydrofolate dehydrogenase/methenyltetrahydrofolate cyclohydrolase FolD [Hippea maritima]AEA33685.1 Bifunctional protein folD [Hippea maritima DSM 10411]
MVLLDGKALSKKIKEEIKKEVKILKEKGVIPGLAVILVGDNPASQVYVNMKTKACEEVGIYSINHRMPAEITENELIDVIKMLNNNPMVHGILVQLPLPSHIREERIIEAIDYTKDVDGFHPYNIGRLARGNPLFSSCTPLGIMKMFEEYAIELQGKDVVMVGAGNITGKPMTLMLLNANATVQVCHVYTQDLKEKTKQADVVISAVGKPSLITEDMVKEGAIVIDVGISRVNGKVVGDVDFENVSKKASYITPVPGGVGPMTIAMLLYNTLLSVKLKEK